MTEIIFDNAVLENNTDDSSVLEFKSKAKPKAKPKLVKKAPKAAPKTKAVTLKSKAAKKVTAKKKVVAKKVVAKKVVAKKAVVKKVVAKKKAVSNTVAKRAARKCFWIEKGVHATVKSLAKELNITMQTLINAAVYEFQSRNNKAKPVKK